jgi:hypothetical protein
MLRRSAFALVAMTAVLTGCPRNGDREVAPETVGVAPTDDPGAMPAAAQTVDLEPVAGEAVEARAVVIPVGHQSQVTIHLRRAAPNTSYTAHLMIGSCAQPGPTTADLQPVVTDAAGTGTSQIVIDVPPEIIINGNHLVELRAANGRDGVRAACGDIPPTP